MRSLRQLGLFLAVSVMAVATACSTGTAPSAGPAPTVTPSQTAASSGGSTSPTAGPATPSRSSTPATSTPTSPAAPTPTSSPEPDPTPAPTGTCSAKTKALSDVAVAGQLLMISVNSSGLTSANGDTITQHRIGSVFLLENSTAGVDATRTLAHTIHALDGGRTHIMLAADQEGGLVQRLQGSGFDRIPSARTQSAYDTSRLKAAATTWGQQLESAGIDLDLAPVADVVPKDLEKINQPIGRLQRGYGPDPDLVSSHVLAFADGMRAAGRAVSVKHFPGLGRVRGNTDFESGVEDSTTTGSDHSLDPFKAAVKADVPTVMVSLAVYTKIDPRQQAVFSYPIVTDLLRHELGFNGVIVSDDLGLARQVANVRPGDRALRFIRAGGDLITVSGNTRAATMAAAIVAEMDANPAFAKIARTAAQRVLVMKHRYGRYPC